MEPPIIPGIPGYSDREPEKLEPLAVQVSGGEGQFVRVLRVVVYLLLAFWLGVAPVIAVVVWRDMMASQQQDWQQFRDLCTTNPEAC